MREHLVQQLAIRHLQLVRARCLILLYRHIERCLFSNKMMILCAFGRQILPLQFFNLSPAFSSFSCSSASNRSYLWETFQVRGTGSYKCQAENDGPQTRPDAGAARQRPFIARDAHVWSSESVRHKSHASGPCSGLCHGIYSDDAFQFTACCQCWLSVSVKLLLALEKKVVV